MVLIIAFDTTTSTTTRSSNTQGILMKEKNICYRHLIVLKLLKL